MPDDFRYDVFLSHSAKDKPIVRDLAKRLKKERRLLCVSTTPPPKASWRARIVPEC